MNKLSRPQRVRILSALVEGCSIRSTARLTGADKETVMRLLVSVAPVCMAVQDKLFRNLSCKLIQCDEIWSFVGCKEKNVPAELKDDPKRECGDVWTWTSICADSKLIPSWCVGPRDTATARAFISDLAGRLKYRVQLTTDGHKPYLEAIEEAFGADIDYAMLVKQYGAYIGEGTERRYSPSACTGAKKVPITGDPKSRLISTSYVERANLTMRMAMRRFTRLTNAFSKKVFNHACAVSLHFFHYNLCRVHQSLRVTPAMAAGVTNHIWELEELVGLLEEVEAEAPMAKVGRKPGQKNGTGKRHRGKRN